MKKDKVFCFHHGWHFLLADEFPMQKALEKHKDKNGRCFYELDYIEENWERVTPVSYTHLILTKFAKWDIMIFRAVEILSASSMICT